VRGAEAGKVESKWDAYFQRFWLASTSPLFASLSGLPPLLVQTGTADLLFSDSERLATAAATVFGGRILSRGDSKGAPGYIPRS
jgi:acetyl esterase/lipase